MSAATDQTDAVADAAQLIEAIARAVAEAAAPEIATRVLDQLASMLGAQAGNPGPRVVDAAALATRLGTTRGFVYDHAAELGGRRLGDGPRARLRFDLDRAFHAWNARSTSEKSQSARTAATTAPTAPRRQSGKGRRAAGLPEPGSVLAIRGPENRRRAA